MASDTPDIMPVRARKAHVPIQDKFPELFVEAEGVSSGGEHSYNRLTFCGLVVAFLAAIGGAVSVQHKFGGRAIDLGAALAGVSFLVGIFVAYYLINTKPERSWYEGRAAAESIKTLSWQYCVGGGPFALNVSGIPEAIFVDKLRAIDRTLKAAQLTMIGQGSQITPEMRAVRAQPLSDRMAIYVAERLKDQNTWYANKASYNHRRAKIWFATAIALQGLGVIFAALKVFGYIHIDALGIIATASAGISAWLQTKDHQNLAESYAVTARELALIITDADILINAPSEDAWGDFVQDAEHAISREHTLWLARRGAQGSST
jgi:hypothetical protein